MRGIIDCFVSCHKHIYNFYLYQMNLSDISILVVLLGMAIISGLIGYEFSRSKEIGKMRSLWLELFITKTWLYGSTAIYFVLYLMGWLQGEIAWALLIINLPTFLVKVRLYWFIKRGK